MSNRSAQNQQVNLEISATVKNTLDDGTTVASHSIAPDLMEELLEVGVSAGEANRAWSETNISITSGNTLDINLRTCGSRDVGAGTGKDAIGLSVLHEEIVGLVIHKTGGEGVLEINPTLPTSPVAWIPQNSALASVGGGLKTGGIRFYYEKDTDGLDTSPTTANVRFRADSGDVTFALYIMGRHDDDDSSSSNSSSTSSSSLSSSSKSSSSTSSSSVSA